LFTNCWISRIQDPQISSSTKATRLSHQPLCGVLMALVQKLLRLHARICKNTKCLYVFFQSLKPSIFLLCLLKTVQNNSSRRPERLPS
jgi:hypothetical protein